MITKLLIPHTSMKKKKKKKAMRPHLFFICTKILYVWIYILTSYTLSKPLTKNTFFFVNNLFIMIYKLFTTT